MRGSAVRFIIQLLLNVFLILGSLVPFLISVVLIIYRNRSVVERMIRGLALFAGTLTVVGLDAAGVSFARFTIDALGAGGLAGALVKVFSAAVALAAGYGVGMYLVVKLRSSRNIAIRGMIFIGVIVHIELLELYVNALHRDGFTIGAGAIPNAGFLVGLIAYVVLNYDPQDPQHRISTVVRDVWRSRSGDDGGPGAFPAGRRPPSGEASRPVAPKPAPAEDPRKRHESGPYTDRFPEGR
jgi:hypothetical protein